MPEFYAHSVEGRPPSHWETMAEHEHRTTRLCRHFLHRIDPLLDPWGEPLGHWHDLGKYQAAFRDKLAGERIHLEHTGVGAAMAYSADARRGLSLAFAIAGHHTGLANARTNDHDRFAHITRNPLAERLREGKRTLEQLLPSLPDSLKSLSLPPLPPWLSNAGPNEASLRSFAFFTRMLFSVLVDADRLATGEFYARAEGREPERSRLSYDCLASLRDRLDSFVDRLAAGAVASRPSAVNAIRAEVLAACRQAARQPPGLFSLTVPTGGGKTLSAMSFALRHAVTHGLERVIVVIPFTSIIEQNAERYLWVRVGKGS